MYSNNKKAAVITITVYANNASVSGISKFIPLLLNAIRVILIPKTITGSKIGKANTLNKAPRDDAFAIIAATIVPPAERLIAPNIIVNKKSMGLLISKLKTAINKGITIISTASNSVKLNNSFPIKISFGCAISLSVSAV